MQESRLFRIVYYLLDKGKSTAPELAEKFEVSVRTIYRDIDIISSMGIPVYAMQGNAHLIGKSVECQVVFFCECENFFVALVHSVQVTLVKSSQIFASGRQVQDLLVCEQGNLYEQSGIIIKITVKEAGNGDHRTIGSILFFLLR